MNQFLKLFLLALMALALGSCGTTGGQVSDEAGATALSAEEGELAAEEEAERQAELELINELMSAKVFFEYDDSTVDAKYYDVLQAQADYLNLTTDAILEIQGHTDERGSTDYNQALGERRADAIFEELLDLGVSEGQVVVVSFGESRPIEYGQDELSWSLNRRVEFLYQ